MGTTLAIPFVGTWLTLTLFGGEFPGRVVENLYVIHLVVPALVLVVAVLRARRGRRSVTLQAGGLFFTKLRLSFESVIWVLRVVVLLGPLVAYAVARTVCTTLRAAEADRLRHGAESGRIVRSPCGGCTEVHEPVPAPAVGANRRTEVSARPTAP